MTSTSSIRNVPKSAVPFWILAAYFLVLGVVYLALPIAPFHQEIIGMSAGELASAHPSMYALMTALVDVSGASCLAIAVAFLVFGRDAHRRASASLALVGLLVAYTLPATYVVYRIDGPVVLAAIPLAIHLAGLGLLYTRKEWTLGAGEPTS